MLYRRMLSMWVILGVGLLTALAEGADQQVVLMLGGEFCANHMRAVGTALKKVEGVKSVILQACRAMPSSGQRQGVSNRSS